MPIHCSEEYQICCAVMDFAKLYRIDKYIIHIPNEGKRTKWYGKALNNIGLKTGASDWFIAKAAHGYHGFFLEQKTLKGKATDNQVKFLNEMKNEGYYTAISYTLDTTLTLLRWWFDK